MAVEGKERKPEKPRDIIKGDRIPRKVYLHMNSKEISYKAFKTTWPKLWPQVGFLQRVIHYNEEKDIYWCDKREFEDMLKQRLKPYVLRHTLERRLRDDNGIRIGLAQEEKKDETLIEIYEKAMKSIKHATRQYIKQDINKAEAEYAFEKAKLEIRRVYNRNPFYIEDELVGELEMIAEAGRKLLKKRGKRDLKEEQVEEQLQELEKVVREDDDIKERIMNYERKSEPRRYVHLKKNKKRNKK